MEIQVTAVILHELCVISLYANVLCTQNIYIVSLYKRSRHNAIRDYICFLSSQLAKSELLTPKPK